ncbi:hypothetical protein [Acetobacter oeni]|uniref:Uncharacterized protein n=1 Tax=Acetobacter oeni TaxID=304077 RepID=A0A511XKZ6_9PROT|nr:hypothetical protein [Acetobacter oeni]MBB3883221.1 hypothetical protein [Acetobacter oeni]NHO19287.1 hypothetical protein [Acetobacter oeni]GBR07271.1 hypothetical protein AA21952_2296 [Acetobacter oeni LMG 21952]GEN63630.1 hypothetical protein AOE01nite_18540 [Acetobacter oeni]
MEDLFWLLPDYLGSVRVMIAAYFMNDQAFSGEFADWSGPGDSLALAGGAAVSGHEATGFFPLRAAENMRTFQ